MVKPIYTTINTAEHNEPHSFINLTSGRIRVKRLKLNDKHELLKHQYIIILDDDLGGAEFVQVAHIVSIK